MESIKAVKLHYKPTEEIFSLFTTFRQMSNDAITIAIAQDASSRFDLISQSYDHLKQYGLHSHYILNACEVAYAVYKKWREDAPEKVREILTLPYFRKRDVLEELVRRRIPLPFVKRPFLKLDNQSYRLDYLLLRIPIQARKFVFITLNGSLYHRSFLADKSLKRGSVTLTDSTVVIAFHRKTEDLEALGQIGIDVVLPREEDRIGAECSYVGVELCNLVEKRLEVRGLVRVRVPRNREGGDGLEGCSCSEYRLSRNSADDATFINLIALIRHDYWYPLDVAEHAISLLFFYLAIRVSLKKWK